MAGSVDGIDQWLQKMTIGRVPIPDKTIGCQTLVKQEVSHKGWLKRKKPLKVTSTISSLFSSFIWDRKYVVLSKGCMYFYNSASDKKPEKAISLFGYTTVMRAGEFRAGRDGTLWPFKLAYVLDEKDKVHYFSADSEDEMILWLRRIKREMYRANGFELTDDDVEQEDFSDLETPISTENYFHRFTDLSKIKETANVDDSDGDSDYEKYDYIDDSVSLKSGFFRSQEKPHKKVPSPPPLSSKESPKSAKLPPLPPEKPAKTAKAFEPSTEHQALTLKNSKLDPPYAQQSIGKTSWSPVESPPSGIATKPKPVPPTPRGTQAPAKVPPATPVKQKPKFSSQDSNENPSSAQTSRWNLSEEPSSTSVASKQKNLVSELAGNLQSRQNEPQATKTPGKVALSPNSSMAKPLPELPLAARTSNAPTAIVAPVRQPVTTENTRVPPGSSGVSRYDGDLETAAMWTRSAGEGQRLLVELAQEGCYMIRPSSDEMNSYTLLVIADCQIRKYKIFTNENDMYSLLTDFTPGFDSLHNLLNHYRSNYLPKRHTKLSRPYSELQRRR